MKKPKKKALNNPKKKNKSYNEIIKIIETKHEKEGVEKDKRV